MHRLTPAALSSSLRFALVCGLLVPAACDAKKAASDTPSDTAKEDEPPLKKREAPDEKGAEATIGGVAGIYQMTSLTQTDGSCEGAGESVLDKRREKYFVVSPPPPQLAGAGYVGMIQTCVDEAACKEKVGKLSSGELIRHFDGSEGDAMVGSHVSSGGSFDGAKCENATVESHTFTRDGDEARFEQKMQVGEYPKVDGGCGTGEAKEALKGEPCNRRIVIEGKRVADV